MTAKKISFACKTFYMGGSQQYFKWRVEKDAPTDRFHWTVRGTWALEAVGMDFNLMVRPGWKCFTHMRPTVAKKKSTEASF